MKKSLYFAFLLLTLLPVVTELGIGVCWAQSYMEEMMSWSMCFNDTRGYYTVFDNDCGNDKECRECLLCCDNWVVEDLYEEHLLMAHGIGGDPDGPNDPDPDPSSGNGDPDEPEGLGTSGGTGEGNTSATGYGEPDSGILLPQVNVNGHYEPPTPDFMLDNQNYSNDGIGYIGGGGGGSSQSQNNNSSDGKLTIQNVLDLLNGMPGKFYELLKELYDAEKIVYVESLKNARYFQESKTLKIGPNYTLDVVTHELIHYLQDKMGMLDFDNSSSNNEFQTYLLNYIYGWSYGLPAPPMGLSNDTEWWNELQLKIADFVEMESTTISKEILDILNGIDYNIRVKKFSDYYKEISKDWDLKPASNWNSYNENYNYRWKEFMEEIGFNFK